MLISSNQTLSNGQTQGFSLGNNGNSLRQHGSIRIEAPSLQEYKEENGKRTFVGEAIVGDEAQRILASYMEANKERILERFKTTVDITARKTDFMKKDRGLQDGETVEIRAARYIRGMVLGALNTIPGTINVAGHRYLYSKMSYSKEFDPYELDAVLSGKRSIGQGEAILPLEDTSGNTSTNVIAVPKDTLQEAVSYFMQKLNIKLQGNTLYANNIAVVSFTSADVNSKILGAAPSYSLDDIKVEF